MTKEDWEFHCKILGISESASDAEIKATYRELAKILHPDKHANSELAKQKFQQLQSSFEYLSNSKNRLGKFESAKQQHSNQQGENNKAAEQEKTYRPKIKSSLSIFHLVYLFPIFFVSFQFLKNNYQQVTPDKNQHKNINQVDQFQTQARTNDLMKSHRIDENGEVPVKPQNSNITPIEQLKNAAGSCFVKTGSLDQPRDYMLAFADSLLHARLAREELKNDSGELYSRLIHLKRARQEFACAMLQIADFHMSQLEMVRTSASSTLRILNDQFGVVGAFEKIVLDALDGKSLAIGALTNMLAELKLESENAWTDLLPSGIAITYAIIDEKHHGFLSLSQKDRTDIIHRLESSVSKTYKNDNRAIEVTVAELVKFLSNKSWKSAKSK